MMGESQGVWYQSVEYPVQLFADDAEWRLDALGSQDPGAPAAAIACDLLVIHMLSTPELESIIRLRRALGRPTVYEISDNILALGDWLPPTHMLRSPLVRQQILHYAALCDGIQTYSPGVAAAFATLGDRVTVVDYSLPHVPERMPDKPEGFVFGWSGSTSHREDLLALSAVVTEFCRRHSDAVFAFMGDRRLLDECFGGIPSSQLHYRPFSPHPQYLEFVQGWHAGIAPAEDTPFSRGRCDAKFVEYGAGGAFPLLSDIPIYRPHAGHARLFGNPGELEAALEDLYRDREALNGLAEGAYEWVRANRTSAAGREARKSFYRSLLRPDAVPVGEPIEAASPALAAEYATALDAFRNGQHELSLQLCRELLRTKPDYAQAAWLEASALDALGRYDELLDSNSSGKDSPVYSDLHAELDYHAACRVRPDEARCHFERIGSPLRRLRLQAREVEDKLGFYREVLRHHPYDFFAIFALIQLLTKAGIAGGEEMDSLWKRASLVAPERVPAAQRPAHLAPYLPC
jgi:tetratricopeptide (TPR) repeat protein